MVLLVCGHLSRFPSSVFSPTVIGSLPPPPHPTSRPESLVVKANVCLTSHKLHFRWSQFPFCLPNCFGVPAIVAAVVLIIFTLY